MTLHDFLVKYQSDILTATEKKTLELAGSGPSSERLRQGLPIFYQQLMEVLRLERSDRAAPIFVVDSQGVVQAAHGENEPAMARASGRQKEGALALSAGAHGAELLRLGYSLSHVVHAYGAMCQSITELATKREFTITSSEFHDLNRCLDIAIAGAVTEFQAHRNAINVNREAEQLGFLAHELRNALTAVNISLQLIKRGTVGFAGNTGHVLDEGLRRIGELIDRSLTEVRLHVDPEVHVEPIHLLQMIDQILMTAEVEARARNQIFEVGIDPDLIFEADQQLLYSAVSNLIQNAVKYSRGASKIQIRAKADDHQVFIEVEDECGGINSETEDLFKPFVQKDENKTGLGLGLTIARRAVMLNQGTIEVSNVPGRGCIFSIKVPRFASTQSEYRRIAR